MPRKSPPSRLNLSSSTSKVNTTPPNRYPSPKPPAATRLDRKADLSVAAASHTSSRSIPQVEGSVPVGQAASASVRGSLRRSTGRVGDGYSGVEGGQKRDNEGSVRGSQESRRSTTTDRRPLPPTFKVPNSIIVPTPQPPTTRPHLSVRIPSFPPRAICAPSLSQISKNSFCPGENLPVRSTSYPESISSLISSSGGTHSSGLSIDSLSSLSVGGEMDSVISSLPVEDLPTPTGKVVHGVQPTLREMKESPQKAKKTDQKVPPWLRTSSAFDLHTVDDSSVTQPLGVKNSAVRAGDSEEGRKPREDGRTVEVRRSKAAVDLSTLTRPVEAKVAERVLLGSGRRMSSF